MTEKQYNERWYEKKLFAHTEGKNILITKKKRFEVKTQHKSKPTMTTKKKHLQKSMIIYAMIDFVYQKKCQTTC